MVNRQPRLRVVPCSIRQANVFIQRTHRHHGPVPTAPGGYRYCLAVVDDRGEVRGVATVGRPVGANLMSEGMGELTAEVSRVATDGCPNACSALYGAAARSAKALGYSRIITYILDSEPGTSLKASGWTQDAGTYGGVAWTNRAGRSASNQGPKGRWSLDLNAFINVRWPDLFTPDGQEVLAL